MNDTASPFLHSREAFVRGPVFRFLAGLLLFALSCGLSFLLAPLAASGGVFLAVSPAADGHPAAVLSVLRCLFPAASALFLLYAAAHTPWSAAVSGAVIGWRGLCLGCAGALMKNGTVVSIGRYWVPALLLYFAASVLVILLASCAHAVSREFCRSYADGNVRRFRKTAADWLRLFLVIAGGVFALTAAAVLLIQGS